MEIKILKHEEIVRLRGDIKNNVKEGRYGYRGFSDYLDTSKVHPIKDTSFNEALFSKLDLKIGGTQDAINAKIIYKSLEGLTPYNARDSRVWTFLSHTNGIKFSLRKISNMDDPKEKVEAVKTEFFIAGNDARSYHSRHSLSKLWWAAHLCATNSELPLDQALEVFCTQTDFRAQVMERPNTFSDPNVFGAMLKIASKRWNGSTESSPFNRRGQKNDSPQRRWNAKINRHGGVRLLSIVGRDAVEDLLEETANLAQQEFEAYQNSL